MLHSVGICVVAVLVLKCQGIRLVLCHDNIRYVFNELVGHRYFGEVAPCTYMCSFKKNLTVIVWVMVLLYLHGKGEVNPHLPILSLNNCFLHIFSGRIFFLRDLIGVVNYIEASVKVDVNFISITSQSPHD